MKSAMDVSDLANKYIQTRAIWDKNIDKMVLANSLFILVNVIRLTGVLLEPFIPTFSAKLYFILNLKRQIEDETLIGRLFEAKNSAVILSLVKQNHEIQHPVPLVTPSIIISPSCRRIPRKIFRPKEIIEFEVNKLMDFKNHV